MPIRVAWRALKSYGCLVPTSIQLHQNLWRTGPDNILWKALQVILHHSQGYEPLMEKPEIKWTFSKYYPFLLIHVPWILAQSGHRFYHWKEFTRAVNPSPFFEGKEADGSWISDVPISLSLRWIQLFVIPWTVACQATLPMEFSKQEYRSGLPCPPPGDLPNPGIEPAPLASPVLAGGFFFSFFNH